MQFAMTFIDIAFLFAMKYALYQEATLNYNASGGRMTEDLTVLGHVP